MSLDQLDILQEKIFNVLTIIEELQAENDKLKIEKDELVILNKQKDQMINALNNDIKKLKEQHQNLNRYLKREGEIKKKVENILFKLDTLQKFSSL